MNIQKIKIRCQNCEQLYEIEWDLEKELPMLGYCCETCYPESIGAYYRGKEIRKIYEQEA